MVGVVVSREESESMDELVIRSGMLCVFGSDEEVDVEPVGWVCDLVRGCIVVATSRLAPFFQNLAGRRPQKLELGKEDSPF